AKKGEAIYFHAADEHQIFNRSSEHAPLILVATESYL
ncbi:Cro/Cl family transcriptional regulator, partial [Listeria monocytogenes]|nr:Cro/Cl family transcriptional regulator [Listeria monocytogenes]